MFDKETSKRMLELNESLGVDKQVLQEGKYPANSMYGYMEKMWADMCKTMASVVPKKYVKFGKYSPVSVGTFMVPYDGFTRGDFECSGWVSMYTDGKLADILVINLSHKGLYGTTEETWRMAFRDDGLEKAKQIGNWIKQKVENS